MYGMFFSSCFQLDFSSTIVIFALQRNSKGALELHFYYNHSIVLSIVEEIAIQYTLYKSLAELQSRIVLSEFHSVLQLEIWYLLSSEVPTGKGSSTEGTSCNFSLN